MYLTEIDYSLDHITVIRYFKTVIYHNPQTNKSKDGNKQSVVTDINNRRLRAKVQQISQSCSIFPAVASSLDSHPHRRENCHPVFLRVMNRGMAGAVRLSCRQTQHQRLSSSSPVERFSFSRLIVCGAGVASVREPLPCQTSDCIRFRVSLNSC